MRFFNIAVALLISAAGTAIAQEQEAKLMDRLLKPDMALQNGAQHKRFAVSGATMTKATPTKAFQYSDRSLVKTFGGMRNYRAQEFHTTTSIHQRTQANLSTRNSLTESRASYRTSDYNDVHVAHDTRRAVETSAFAENKRPFLVQGKSQKFLSAQDRPLTLEQVRELLNKNK